MILGKHAKLEMGKVEIISNGGSFITRSQLCPNSFKKNQTLVLYNCILKQKQPFCEANFSKTKKNLILIFTN